MTADKLDDLFPAPSLLPAMLCPQRYPGNFPEAIAALRHALKDNHIKHHVFYTEEGLLELNHITHRALALYATGASGALIEHFYKLDSTLQRPVVDPPEVITEENFIEHLSDDRYYAAYVAFFMKSIDKKGSSATLDEYIFSKKYNFIEGRDASTQPAMLIRFFASILHPFMQVGYGTKFGIPGMVAEGLAMASAQKSHRFMFLPSSLFEHDHMNVVEEANTQVALLPLNIKSPIAPPELDQPKGNHAFSILANIIQDPQFAPEEIQKYINALKRLVTERSADIWRYTEQWTIDLSQPGEIERKIEECIWTNTIIYAIGGWSKEKGFTANLFFMHLVTSSLCLSSMLSYLPRDSQVILLRAYFQLTLAWWISRGGPQLDVQGFLNATDPVPSSVGDVPSNTKQFLDIIQSGHTHPDEHLVETQRALAHFSSLYGGRPKGYFKGTELEGAEALDGSLFLRAARLTDQYISHSSWSETFEVY
ncbi:hypothetical protein K503DRAFT_694635 [Rhizopogon vinicolor AM-OR11-026]|uniref:Oxidoreductase AflY n=1 Tax=Rhizopogon vinicolor AM-OR11-026 TaxID=1314800 RepID=A0A1B7MVQ5_9AGAM|nr:hypothetical protein K503DRAFT_694635 [Rhizopogon vinicolor AM-OR11-026]